MLALDGGRDGRYQVLVLLTQSSMMYFYEEREPFQLFALIGTIGEEAGAVVGSGRRRSSSFGDA